MSVVTFSGVRTGTLSNLRALCSNQYPGVQIQGALDGKWYELSIGDPAMGATYPDDLYEFTDNTTHSQVGLWHAGPAGVTEYDARAGAAFDVEFSPNTTAAHPGDGPLHATGRIVC